MSTNHIPDTLIYLSDLLLVNPNSPLPWILGAWDLALLGTGSFSGLVPSRFDSLKSVGTPSTQLRLGDVEEPGVNQTQL